MGFREESEGDSGGLEGTRCEDLGEKGTRKGPWSVVRHGRDSEGTPGGVGFVGTQEDGV